MDTKEQTLLMLIDDNKGDQVLFEYILSKLPLINTLVICDSHEDADKELLSQGYDIIFMDLNLGAGSNIDQALAFVDRYSTMRFVILTGVLTNKIVKAFEHKNNVLESCSKDDLNPERLSNIIKSIV